MTYGSGTNFRVPAALCRGWLADRDIGRRRTAFAEVLDAGQMREWESVVAGYRTGLLRRFGHREPDAVANTLKPAGGTG